jgi:hypothetical protein
VVAAAVRGGEAAEDAGGDLLDPSHAVDHGEQAAVAVVVDQGPGLDPEHLQAVADRLLGVIGPMLGRRPPGQPTQQLLLVGLEVEHGVQGHPQVDQAPVQGLGLVDRPGEPVQHEPTVTVRLGQPLHHHGDDHLVRHQVTAVHVLLSGPTQLGPLGHIRPEDVPGGDVGAAEPASHLSGLRALSSPRRAEENDTHRCSARLGNETSERRRRACYQSNRSSK